MSNAVVGGAVATVLGLAAIGAYVYIEKQKLQMAPVSAVPLTLPAPTPSAPVTAVPSAAQALTDLYGIPATSGNSLMVTANTKATVWLAQTVNQDSTPSHVVFVGKQEIDAKGELVNNAHASGVPLDAITYRLSGGQWSPVLKQSQVLEAGSWGELQEAKPAEVVLLGNATALLISQIGSGQGYTYVGKSVVALEQTGWKYLGTVNVGADNSGACEEDPKKINADSLPACWNYTGTINAGSMAPGKAYPDLLVNRTGTMADEARKVVPATAVAVKFNGPLYEEQ